MSNLIATLIIAPPGRFRDSLRVLLRANDMIALPEQASDGPAALRLIDANPPALVLVDADLQNDDVWRVLRQIHQKRPQIQVIVFTHTPQQQRKAQQFHTCAVLADGFTSERLFKIISQRKKES